MTPEKGDGLICLWFGSDGHSGHHYHPDKIGPEQARHLSPWGDFIDNGKLYDRRQRQGLARLHYKNGWTSIQFADRTGDSRPGSHTAFLFNRTLTFAEALAQARSEWPQLFERFTFDIVSEASARDGEPS